MAQKILEVTESGTSTAYKIGEDAVSYVEDLGTVREISYVVKNQGMKKIQVTQALSGVAPAIDGQASNLFAVTSTANGNDILLNADRVENVVTEGTGAKIDYTDGVLLSQEVVVDETQAAVIAAINAL